MEYSFYDLLKLLGSLAMFLYGMKIMSEGLQKFAGDRLRSILTAMTTNRVTGVLTGVLITALIQSSSATTVMVVSFVNAGLLSLSQSIGVIMGANIGTTVTAWIISALGFKVDMAAMSLPLLAVGVPLLFSGKSSRKSIGEFIFGFSFLFMGLSLLKANAPDLGKNPEMLSFVQNYTDMGFASVILFVLIGTVLTMIVQASAATMAITLIMCANGWISFELGAALVLGENIGTTITANLAALTGNVPSKRAAMAHLVFNIFGVIWVLCLFKPVTMAVSWFVEDVMQTVDPAVSVSFKLSAFHTAFNICNKTHTITSVFCAAISAKIKIPPVVFCIKTEFFHTSEQKIKTFFPLATTDKFANTRNKHVHSSNCFVVIVHTHVERFDFFWIVSNKNRTIKYFFCKVSFVFCLQVTAPRHFVFKVVVVLFQNFYCICICHLTKLAVNKFCESFDKTFVNKRIEKLHFLFAVFHNVSDDIFYHILSELHVILQISKSNFWLNHPKLCSVTSCV